jgi:hypothetical protein
MLILFSVQAAYEALDTINCLVVMLALVYEEVNQIILVSQWDTLPGTCRR